MNFTQYATQRNLRTLNLRLAPAGLTGSQAGVPAGIPEGYTMVTAAKTATGVYVVNFGKSFLRVPTVTVTNFHATLKIFAVITALTTSSITIKVYDDTGTAQDATNVLVTVAGFDAADQV